LFHSKQHLRRQKDILFEITDKKTDEILRCVGDKLRAARVSLGYTQEKVAELSQVSVDTIGKAEAGKSVSTRNFVAIASAVGLSPNLTQIPFQSPTTLMPFESTVFLFF